MIRHRPIVETLRGSARSALKRSPRAFPGQASLHKGIRSWERILAEMAG